MFNSFKSLIISILLLSNIAYSKDMQKLVFSEWDKPEINIFYNLPAQITENTTVIFVIHGNSRNADGYLNVWMKLARKYNVLLIAPTTLLARQHYNTFKKRFYRVENVELLDRNTKKYQRTNIINDFIKKKN